MGIIRKHFLSNFTWQWWHHLHLPFLVTYEIGHHLKAFFEYFHMEVMTSCPIAFLVIIQYGYHLKAFFQHCNMAMMPLCLIAIFGNITVGKFMRCQSANFTLYIHMYISFAMFLLLTTGLPCLVSCVLYHLVQLNFLHFMSVFTDFSRSIFLKKK